jgi:hypothetical protein
MVLTDEYLNILLNAMLNCFLAGGCRFGRDKNFCPCQCGRLSGPKLALLDEVGTTWISDWLAELHDFSWPPTQDGRSGRFFPRPPLLSPGPVADA